MNCQIESIWQKKLGEQIDFDHKDTTYKLKFDRLKFGEPQTIYQIHQTFPLPNIPAVQYIHLLNRNAYMWVLSLGYNKY